MHFHRNYLYIFAGLVLLFITASSIVVGCKSSSAGTNQEQPIVNQNSNGGVSNLYPDVSIGFTDDGYPYRGNPDAPVTVYEFSDYLCPFCGRHNNETMPILMEQFAQTGKVKFVFRDFPIEALHPTADIGHLAAICVAEQGAGLFWEMHDQLFARQNQWSGLQDPTEFVVNLAAEIGADMNSFDKCFKDSNTVKQLGDSITEAKDFGFNGTPSFNFQFQDNDEFHPYVGAQPATEFVRIFNTLASSGELPVAPTPEPPELPYWLTTEGLAVDPQNENYTVAGDFTKGNPSASVVVVELSDFQCPSCATHALEIQPIIDTALVDNGQVRWVMKNLPVSEHKRAPLAAAAAECAGEQNSYWQMKELIYESQDFWVNSENDSPFIDLATELDINVDEFSKCFNSRSALERVFNDLFDAQQAGIFRTPSFIIVSDGEATLLEGSREGPIFIGILENSLERVSESE